MIADDLFAGAGGWDLAAARLGIHARGVENMKEARATRDAAGLSTIHDDVWTFKPDGAAEGLIASPPCQTFSAAGKGSGRKALDDVLRGIRDNYVSNLDHLHFLGEEVGDNRTALVLTPLHYALTGGYEWLAWEQVPTVLPVWEACAEVLRGKGWHVWTGKLNAEQYGVPQTRTRAFLLASRHRPVAPPTPTHSRYYSNAPERLDAGLPRWLSMAEGIGWGLTKRPSYTVCGVSSHAVGDSEWGGASVRQVLREAANSGDPAAWTDLDPADDLPEWCYERPATTIVGSFCPDVIAAPGYRTVVSRQNAVGNVRLQIQEAGLLQSFPVDYPWRGAKGKQFLQAGNAVPPGLALHALMAASGVDAREVAA
jgi:DNA (cytosine-5)-methyltransferase 1